MTDTRPNPTIRADDYRRAARRLRATFRHDRPRLYRSLQSLSARKPRIAEPDERPAARFASLVVQSLDCTVLRYSERLKLLRIARHFNIDRFEANLIIAAVQHRMKARADAQPQSHVRHGWLLALGIFLLVQLAIALGIWKILSA